MMGNNFFQQGTAKRAAGSGAARKDLWHRHDNDNPAAGISTCEG
jgi:hypothetical protein